MAVKMVKAAPADNFLDLDDLERPIQDRFKWAAEEMGRACEQWKLGLVSDDELSWRCRDLSAAQAERNKLKTVRRLLAGMGKTYLGRK